MKHLTSEKMPQYEILSDEKIINGLLSNNEDVVRYFFFNKCGPLLGYIIKCIFAYKVERDELINELYIYLSADSWKKLRQFDYRSKLITWFSVVAIRFFQRKRDSLIEYESSEALMIENGMCPFDRIDAQIDIERALERMPNQKYASLLRALDIKDKDPAVLAFEMQTTVSNVYNIRHRAHVQLQTVINEKVIRT